MKTFALLLISACCHAGPLLIHPVLTPDGETVVLSSLGGVVAALPNAFFTIWMEDGINGYDFDVNDAVGRGRFNSTATQFAFTYFASVTALADTLGPVGFTPLSLGQSAIYSSSPGDIVTFQMRAAQTGNSFYSGPASLNIDNVPHDFVTECVPPSQVPEPATIGMIGAALIALGMLRKKSAA